MTQGVKRMDLESFSRQLEASGLAEKLRGAAESPECRRLGELLGGDKLAAAARSGDERAIKGLLSEILNTEEGRRLAGRIKDAMK